MHTLYFIAPKPVFLFYNKPFTHSNSTDITWNEYKNHDLKDAQRHPVVTSQQPKSFQSIKKKFHSKCSQHIQIIYNRI